ARDLERPGRTGPEPLAVRGRARRAARGDTSVTVGVRVNASSQPQALPPDSRPVGQLVGESIRLYGRRFWPSLALGLSLATINQISTGHRPGVQVLILAAGGPLLTASSIRACALGGLATFVLVFFVTHQVMIVLLHNQSDLAGRAALFVTDLVLSPILFLGPALLYTDQVARGKVRA